MRAPVTCTCSIPSSNDGLDACLEVDDADLRVFVKRYDGNGEGVWQTGQAVRLVLIIKCVEHLDCNSILVRQELSVVLHMLASH